MLLYLSQVELLAIHPFYTNLLPTTNIISHHLFPAPCISVWNNYVSIPGLHSLQLFVYSLIARTLYVARVHDGLKGLISSMDGASMHKCVDTILKVYCYPSLAVGQCVQASYLHAGLNPRPHCEKLVEPYAFLACQ